MLKVVFGLTLVLVITEAKFNKYERLKEVFEYVKSNETLMQMFREHKHQHQLAREQHFRNRNRTSRATSSFTCLDGYTPSQTIPNTVHALRPEHISVVAAMGDSLTAGNGILGDNIFDCLTEYRGRSWSIGGDLNFAAGVETFPNILKKYNHALKGYSLGHCDTSDLGCSQLNVAVAGETSQEIPAQAHELVRRLKDPNFGINFASEWKVITLFIGGNDLCEYCHDRDLYSPTNYVAKIREALDYLHANVPRAFVNLAEIFDITPLAHVSQGFFCNLVTGMVCDCAKDSNNNAMLQQTSRNYQTQLRNLVNSGRYDTRNDFTVVLQTFFRDTEPVRDIYGEYDLAYFAPDCFHFSDLGANVAAKSLWNNMIEPISSKQTHWHLHQPFYCPDVSYRADGMFRTYKN